MERIARRTFAQPDRAQAQERFAHAAKSNPEFYFQSYRRDLRSFDGRYVAADLFKEQFAEYRASNVARYLYNAPLHNTVAVLASEWLRRVVDDDAESRRNQVVFLTGVPGAGKTGFVTQAVALPANMRALYEGQLAQPDPAFPKIAAALARGCAVTIAVVHVPPEFALRNTLARFDEIGRGASISVMADIQAGLSGGLARIRAEFGDRVALRVLERSDTMEQQHQGWQHLSILESENDRDRIYARLSKALASFRESGTVSEAAYAQALGQEPRPEHRHLD